MNQSYKMDQIRKHKVLEQGNIEDILTEELIGKYKLDPHTIITFRCFDEDYDIGYHYKVEATIEGGSFIDDDDDELDDIVLDDMEVSITFDVLLDDIYNELYLDIMEIRRLD